MSRIRLLSVLNEAHRLISERLSAGDCVIDATIGNGNDTLALARCVGPSGYVYGFDVQAEAIEHTRQRLEQASIDMERIILTLTSHEHMERTIPEPMHCQIAAIMFNLGYLPGSASKLITLTEATLHALNAAIRLLRSGGIMTIVLYPGHQGGDEEAAAIHSWASQLPLSVYQVTSYQFLNPTNVPPYLITVYKV